jgi:hypothetical protein
VVINSKHLTFFVVIASFLISLNPMATLQAQGTFIKPLPPVVLPSSPPDNTTRKHKKTPSKPVVTGAKSRATHAEYPPPPDDQINVFGPVLDVIDGATLVVGNYTIRLSTLTAIPNEGFGTRMMEWARSQKAPAACSRVNVDFDPQRNFNCNVNGHDLALVSLMNGGADSANTGGYASEAKIWKTREIFIENNPDPVFVTFLAGTFTTSCAQGGCGDEFLSRQYADDINLYRDEQWEPLVRNLLRNSAKLDFYYYLLGSAANHFGSYRAAQRYLAEAQRLFESGSTTERCQFAIPKNCDGADLAYLISDEKHKADVDAQFEF